MHIANITNNPASNIKHQDLRTDRIGFIIYQLMLPVKALFLHYLISILFSIVIKNYITGKIILHFTQENSLTAMPNTCTNAFEKIMAVGYGFEL